MVVVCDWRAKKEKGFRNFLRDKLGEPPVLSNKLNPKLTAENMQSVLENNGYLSCGKRIVHRKRLFNQSTLSCKSIGDSNMKSY